MRWKKEAVGGGGCFRIKMSIGSAELRQKAELAQAAEEQHSESAQSTRPSVRKANRVLKLR